MPSPQPLILLPPSEGKAPGGEGPAWRAGSMADAGLDRHRRVVLPAAAADGVVRRRAPTMSASDRYTGVLYRELDWRSLSPTARRRGAGRVRIASGLWGLVAPDDPIPHYKLKMSARLEATGRLSAWWKPRLAPVLAERVRGAVVWDLLPIEHAAAMDWSACEPAQRVTVRFVDRSGTTVSHWNKLLKGALVRWLLAERTPTPERLASFRHPLGYRLDATSSSREGTLRTLVFREDP